MEGAGRGRGGGGAGAGGQEGGGRSDIPCEPPKKKRLGDLAPMQDVAEKKGGRKNAQKLGLHRRRISCEPKRKVRCTKKKNHFDLFLPHAWQFEDGHQKLINALSGLFFFSGTSCLLCTTSTGWPHIPGTLYNLQYRVNR